MATLNGFKITMALAAPEIGVPLVDPDLSPSIDSFPGEITQHTFNSNFTKIFFGKKKEGTWNVISEGKIYMSPLSISAGLIGADKFYTIEIWNASEDVVYISSIVQSNPSGISLELPTPPIKFTGETVYVYDLTVLKSGPAIQSSTITFYFSNGETRTITITGRRIETFPYSCDASSSVKVSYIYQTIVYLSNQLVEQRRALYDKPRRKLEAAYWFEARQIQQCFNTLKAFINRIVAVPFYPEELTCMTYPLVGQTVLEFDNSLGYCFNLVNRSSLLVIWDEDDPTLYELKEIQAIDTVNNRITLVSAIIKSFSQYTTRVAPAILAFCPEVGNKVLTDTIASFSLTFEEYA